MNYAQFSRKPFVSAKPLETKRTATDHSRAVAQFCATHTISVSVDHNTGRGMVQVTKNAGDRSE